MVDHCCVLIMNDESYLQWIEMYFPDHMLPLLRNGQAKLPIFNVIKIFQRVLGDKMILGESV